MKKPVTFMALAMGTVVKCALLLMVVPHAAMQWYVPFMDRTTSQLTLDPWNLFLANGGADAAFPYGYVMWLAFLPMTLLFKLVHAPIYIAYGLTLFCADVALFFLLRAIFAISRGKLIAFYWLSPIVIWATYYLGLNDIIPITVVLAALYFVKAQKLVPAGILCGAAVSAKLSMVLAIPFFLLFLYNNRAYRLHMKRFAEALVLSLLALYLPFSFSAAGMHMLFANPEMDKIYLLGLQFGVGSTVYMLPLAYLLMLYAATRVRRPNFEIFYALLGLGFFLVVLLTPASPGWFVWIVPLLVVYQVRDSKLGPLLAGTLSGLYILLNIALIPKAADALSNPGFIPFPAWQNWLDGHVINLIQTVLTASSVVLGVRIWNKLVTSNNYFRLSRRPFVIGIAGDSGAGKDTLADAIIGLLGKHSTTHISGDDYHFWDRQKPMWQVMTHLHPAANDLERFANDLLALNDGKTIVSRHYDHVTGKMSKPLRVVSNDFIVASGLHALYLPITRNVYDLSIYLDIDEDLRRFLKVKRDVHVRGHTLERTLTSLDRREPDAARFVRPQASRADLVMGLQPIHPCVIQDAAADRPLRLKLRIRSQDNLNEHSFVRVLIGVCGLHVDVNVTDQPHMTELIIEGETTAKDVELAASILFPNLLDFLDASPRWQDGPLGLMQLAVLSHFNQALSRRLL